jgi:hypothetical protein
MEYGYLYPHRKTFDTASRILRQTGAFPRTNAECEQRRGNSDVLAAMQESPSIYKQIIKKTGKINAQTWELLHHDCLPSV